MSERITTNIQSIFKAGWRPPRAWDHPIAWHRREHNVVAGFLANYTMDRNEFWNKICDWPFPGHGLQDCSFVVHSDGGTRWGTCSGSAFIVEAGVLGKEGWVFKPLALNGTYFHSPMSSFVAESLALEEATVLLQKMICADRKG